MKVISRALQTTPLDRLKPTRHFPWPDLYPLFAVLLDRSSSGRDEAAARLSNTSLIPSYSCKAMMRSDFSMSLPSSVCSCGRVAMTNLRYPVISVHGLPTRKRRLRWMFSCRDSTERRSSTKLTVRSSFSSDSQPIMRDKLFWREVFNLFDIVKSQLQVR